MCEGINNVLRYNKIFLQGHDKRTARSNVKAIVSFVHIHLFFKMSVAGGHKFKQRMMQQHRLYFWISSALHLYPKVALNLGVSSGNLSPLHVGFSGCTDLL